MIRKVKYIWYIITIKDDKDWYEYKNIFERDKKLNKILE